MLQVLTNESGVTFLAAVLSRPVLVHILQVVQQVAVEILKRNDFVVVTVYNYFLSELPWLLRKLQVIVLWISYQLVQFFENYVVVLLDDHLTPLEEQLVV